MRLLAFLGLLPFAFLAGAYSSGERLTSKGIPDRPPLPDEDNHGKILVRRANSSKIAVHAGYFQQLLDHQDPSLGTFTQRFWWNADHYAGPGSPIVLNAPGEGNADGSQGYCTTRTLPGRFAQSNRGAAILLEHRYWGGSSPYLNLTAETLQHLTLDNSIADLVYFARHVRLPFDLDGSSHPDRAPWVLSGCSYPGALTAWTAVLAPGTFWAYHCSSAIVEDISTMWQYYEPIEKALPRNYSADVRRVVAHVDDTLRHDAPSTPIRRLKERFGFGDLKHDDDFATALVGGVQEWQNTQFYTRYSKVHEMCDYIENKWPGSNATTPGLHGVGLDKALDGFAKWSREVMISGSCAKLEYWKSNQTIACYDSYDLQSPMYTDMSVNNTVNRQWMWFLCNEPFEFWQVWGPGSSSDLVSRHLTREYYRRQCGAFFPDAGGFTFGLRRHRSIGQVNAHTGVWAAVPPLAGNASRRLMWVNGEYDPWRPATVSSDMRPGGPLHSTAEEPVWVLPKAAHCNDLIVKNAEANPVVARIMDEEVAKMKS